MKRISKFLDAASHLRLLGKLLGSGIDMAMF
jgi:hypothetical protein